jgi:hypothetical protein
MVRHVYFLRSGKLVLPSWFLDRRLGETCKLVIGQFGHVKERRALIG